MNKDFVTHKINEELYLIRQIDRETKYFEGIWEIPEGIVYNSYLLITDEGVLVFDTVKRGYCEEYIKTLREIVDLRDLKYVVSHHGEPDHSGCVKELSDLTGAFILGHPLLGRELKSFYSLERFKSVGDKEDMKIGNYTVVFHHVPWLHWPETIVTYVAEPRYLFTCDAFGSYGLFIKEIYYNDLPVNRRDEYIIMTRKYFANIIGYYRDWVVKNLEKIIMRDIQPSLILPGHGLIYNKDSLPIILELYWKWGRGEPVKKKITLFYTSMYRFVEKAVEEFINGLRAKGLDPAIYVFNDQNRSNISDFIGEAYDSEVLVFATSTYDATSFPYAKFMVELISKKIPRNKKIVLLASYGWGPRAGQEISSLLQNAGFNDIKLYEFPAGQHEVVVKEAVDYVIKSMSY